MFRQRGQRRVPLFSMKRLSIQRLSEPVRLAIRGSLNACRVWILVRGGSIAGRMVPLVERLFDCLYVRNGSSHGRAIMVCFSPVCTLRMISPSSNAVQRAQEVETTTRKLSDMQALPSFEKSGESRIGVERLAIPVAPYPPILAHPT